MPKLRILAFQTELRHQKDGRKNWVTFFTIKTFNCEFPTDFFFQNQPQEFVVLSSNCLFSQIFDF